MILDLHPLGTLSLALQKNLYRWLWLVSCNVHNYSFTEVCSALEIELIAILEGTQDIAIHGGMQCCYWYGVPPLPIYSSTVL